MKNVVFIASHLGYAMDKTPLGGGAMVGLQLVRHWKALKGVDLTVLGSGSVVPREGVEYVQVSCGNDRLENLSEFAYARFCRKFEAASTEWVLSRRDRFDPKRTCILVNDIAEGPNLAQLTKAGYPVVSVWHVDVVDYFNKLYLKNIFAPERVVSLYEKSRRWGFGWVTPDLLRLIFDKQRETVLHSRRMILPSHTMAETVRRCYEPSLNGKRRFMDRVEVVPWGVWRDGVSEKEAREESERLRSHFQIGPETLVLMTLSRISPEKGIHLLLAALAMLEKDRDFSGRDIVLLIAGEPAFMQGSAYARKVRRAARALKRIRVFFPGYLSAPQKNAYFRLVDLFVSPSIHESYGLNIVEAMQAGIAILSSDHYGVRDLLDPAFGHMVRYPKSLSQAPPRICAALKELLANRAALKEMGSNGREAAARMPFTAAAERVMRTALEVIE